MYKVSKLFGLGLGFFLIVSYIHPSGAAAGTLEFDGVPVDITTADGENLVVVPGTGGHVQIGDGAGTNLNATSNDDIHITGILEADGAAYLDGGLVAGSNVVPDITATHNLGSSSKIWNNLYATNIYANDLPRIKDIDYSWPSLQGAVNTVLRNDGAGNLTWAVAGGGSNLPVSDATSIVEGSADDTKQVRFEVDGLTAGTTRVLTVPDADGTLAVSASAPLVLSAAGDLSLGTVPVGSGGTGTTTAPTGGQLLIGKNDGTYAVTGITAGSNIVVTPGDGTVTISGNASGAPTDATFITQEDEAGLSGEQALSALATGVLKNTTGTGVLSIAAQGTDYYAPGGTDVTVGDGGTGASTIAGAKANLDLETGVDIQAWDADLDTWAGKTPPTGTVVGTTDAQALSAKTLDDATVSFVDDGDISKALKFQLAGLSTLTTRTLTVPDASGTLTVSATSPITLSALGNVSLGNIPVTNLNSGTGATNTTFWRGDATWAAIPASGDSLSVNSTAAADLNFLDSAATGTVPSVAWGLNTVSTPDDLTLAVGAASATEAGVVTTGSQTFAGTKTFSSAVTAPGISSAAGNVTFQAAGAGTTGSVVVGAANGGAGSATPDLLVLDKSSAANPTGVEGAVVIDSTGKFNIYEGGAWKVLCNKTDAACGAGSGAAISALLNATGANSTTNADYAQAWNWSLTSAAKSGFAFGESAAAVNGAGSQYILEAGTAAGSTAGPFKITSQSADVGDILFDLTSAGDFIVADNGTPFASFNDNGTVVFAGDVTVPGEAYDAAGWNADSTAPTKDDVRDKIESLASAAAPTSGSYITQVAESGLSGEQALGSLASGLLKNTTTTGVLSIAAQGTDYYAPGGTDVALMDGGTGASLPDPNADRILFWDDSAGTTEWLTLGNDLAVTGTTLNATGASSADTYLTQTPSGTLANEQALSLLSTGLMQVTTTSGVVSSVTTSAGVAGLLSDETGSSGGGVAVFSNAPALTDPVLTNPIIKGERVVALADAATIATDASLGNVFTVSSATNRILGIPTNPTNGQKCIWRWRNTDGSSRTLTLTTAGAGSFRFGTTVQGTNPTGAGKMDYIGAIYNQTDDRWDVIAYAKGYN